MKILYLSAEVAPFAKVGGLGDVGGGLPRALRARGHEVWVGLPAYRKIERTRYRFTRFGGPYRLVNGSGEQWYGVQSSDYNGVPTFLIEHDALFGGDNIYGYHDDPYRFIFFCQAMLAFAQDHGFQPDVIHCHDWHTSYALAWLDTVGRESEFYHNTAGVLTIHNAAHQGRSVYNTVRYGGLEGRLPALNPWESWGEINWLARGVAHANAINAVSPRFAYEVTTHDGGWGLEELFRARGERLTGILNGIDVEVWNPQTDPNLAAQFSFETLEARIENKRALQMRARLPQRDDVPLIAFVGRLDAQKGVEFMLPALEHYLGTQDVQFVLLGSGASEYERRFMDLSWHQPYKVGISLRFDPELAPLVYGACDIFLMPSLFEPCGLGQLIAMHYGAIPVVRATGGLIDTVEDTNPFEHPPRVGTGFRFEGSDAGSVGWALDRAVQTYRWDKGLWRAMQAHGMGRDFSWTRAAGEYEEWYRRAQAWR